MRIFHGFELEVLLYICHVCRILYTVCLNYYIDNASSYNHG